VRVRGRLAALRGDGRGVLEGLPPCSGQERCRLGRNPGNGSDPGVREAGLVARAVLGQREGDGDPNEREVTVPLVELQPDLARPGWDAGNANTDDELPVLDGGLERGAKEVPRAKTAGAANASQLYFAVQRRHSCRQLGGRIGVREAPAEGAAVSNRHVADLRGRLGKQRASPRDERVALYAAVADERSDRQPRVRFLHLGEAADAVHVHENGRPHQPEVEERPQALAARERLGVAPEACEQLERLLEAPGSVIVEGVRLQPIVPRSSTESSWNGKTFSLPTSRIRSIES
jgi:hypothetical protein